MAQPTFICPHCGAPVPRDASACPECGSDERTGWSEEAEDFDPDLPEGYSEDGDFDYDEYVRKEFAWDPDRGSKPPIPLREMVLPAIAIGLIAILIWLVF